MEKFTVSSQHRKTDHEFSAGFVLDIHGFGHMVITKGVRDQGVILDDLDPDLIQIICVGSLYGERHVATIILDDAGRRRLISLLEE